MQLGYLDPGRSIADADRLTPEANTALHDYARRWIGDDATIEGVAQGRPIAERAVSLLDNRQCGVPDIIRSVVHINAFGHPGGRWGRRNLTYGINMQSIPPSLQTSTPSLAPPNAVTQVIGNAVQQWQAAVRVFLKIRQAAPNANADIVVSFVGPNQQPEFAPGKSIIGIGAYPERGVLNFNSNVAWAANLPGAPRIPQTQELLPVALHELGHVLGLAHSTNPSSIMYPIAITPSGLDPESIRAIQELYDYWEPQQSLGDRASSDGPSLAVSVTTSFTTSAERLFMAWRGIDGDSRIFWSEFDNEWSPQEPIEGIGSSHGPALASSALNRSRQEFGTGLFMAWKGVRDDTTIWFSQNPDLAGWTPQQSVPDVGTSCRPALREFGGIMFMAWKGVPGDSRIFWSTFDGKQWAPQREIIGRGTSTAPTLAVLGNRLYMVWKGIPGDSRVFYAWLDNAPGAIWQAQQEVAYPIAEAGGIGSVPIGTSHHPSATTWSDSIVLAWKGVVGDSRLWFAPFQNGEWSGQIDMQDAGTSSGPAIAEFDGRLYMAWKGIEGDSGLYWSRLS